MIFFETLVLDSFIEQAEIFGWFSRFKSEGTKVKCKKSGKIQILKSFVPCVYLIGVDLQNDFNIGNLKTMTRGRCMVVLKAVCVYSLLGIEGSEGSPVDAHSLSLILCFPDMTSLLMGWSKILKCLLSLPSCN